MKNFYSRLLLFGEYAQLYGSNSLAMPLDLYSGELGFTGKEDKRALASNKILSEYFQFLKKNKDKFQFLNIDSFENDINEGLFFSSTIPQNYGLGSSGALVAAVFDRYHYYGSGKNLQELRIMFANLESWFRGKNLGIDSLVSYMNHPIVFKNNIAEIVPLNQVSDDDFKIFLVDTGQESSTGFQTRSFQQILKNKMSYYLFLENYIPYINSAITFFLENNLLNFSTVLADMVDFQYKFFKILFPSFTRELIREGLDKGAYLLKLCGAGGGGFLLGFTQDLESTRQLLAQKNVDIIEVNLKS
jgi:mevalonate kinase